MKKRKLDEFISPDGRTENDIVRRKRRLNEVEESKVEESKGELEESKTGPIIVDLSE